MTTIQDGSPQSLQLVRTWRSHRDFEFATQKLAYKTLSLDFLERPTLTRPTPSNRNASMRGTIQRRIRREVLASLTLIDKSLVRRAISSSWPPTSYSWLLCDIDPSVLIVNELNTYDVDHFRRAYVESNADGNFFSNNQGAESI
jgi:hypothetical protein